MSDSLRQALIDARIGEPMGPDDTFHGGDPDAAVAETADVILSIVGEWLMERARPYHTGAFSWQKAHTAEALTSAAYAVLDEIPPPDQAVSDAG